jgi:hypothetical protein
LFAPLSSEAAEATPSFFADAAFATSPPVGQERACREDIISAAQLLSSFVVSARIRRRERFESGRARPLDSIVCVLPQAPSI